jgi:hypothetical protein
MTQPIVNSRTNGLQLQISRSKMPMESTTFSMVTHAMEEEVAHTGIGLRVVLKYPHLRTAFCLHNPRPGNVCGLGPDAGHLSRLWGTTT